MKRGCIFSQMFENDVFNKELLYDMAGHTLKMNVKACDGIIYFDERKTHVTNLRQIVNQIYKEKIGLNYQEFMEYKEPKNGFDISEMYNSTMLANIGESVMLTIDKDDSYHNVSSTLLFLPGDFNLLSEKQVGNISAVINSRQEDIFEAALVHNMDEKTYVSKDEVLNMITEYGGKHASK